MAKKSYIGVDSIARKIKKWYVGVDGKARKVKKAYIGVGGVARPFITEGINRYGTITPLSVNRADVKATSIGDYALFAGGHNSDGYSAIVDAYNSSLIQTTAASLEKARCIGGAASNGTYAIFAGGYIYPNQKLTTYNTIDAYNSSLVKSSSRLLFLSYSRRSIGSARVGNYAIFVGGEYGNGGNGTSKDSVDAISSNLKRTSLTALSSAKDGVVGASVGNYGIFAGGRDTAGRAQYTVDVYDSSLVHSTATNLSYSCYDIGGSGDGGSVSVGDYALFYNQRMSLSSDPTIIEVYNSSLVKMTPITTSHNRHSMSTASIGNYAIFAGGYAYINGSLNCVKNVDAYDNFLVRSELPDLSIGLYGTGASSVGNYAIFSGKDTVEAYTL